MRGNDINVVCKINFGFIEMEKLKAEVSTAGRASVLNEENVIDAGSMRCQRPS